MNSQCRTPQELLEKKRKNYNGVFLKVLSKDGASYWKKEGAWITINVETENGNRFYEMSENTFNKIKDSLKVTVVKE